MPNSNPKTQVHFRIWQIMLAFMAITFVRDLWVTQSTRVTIPFSEFQTYLDTDQIEEAVVNSKTIQGKFREKIEGKQYFVTNKVEPSIAADFSKRGVKYSQAIENTFLSDVLAWVLPAFIFMLIWFFLMKKMSGGKGMGGGFMTIGKSKAKIYVENHTKITFGDVAGADEAKGELQEIIAFLKNPDSYGKLGGKMPKGVLLVGPPGTGKTLLAKAVAGEAEVPFFSVSGSEFVEMFVGVGAARVRDLFDQAKQKSPCIIFIDELDALGKARGISGMGGGNDEKEQTLNQLLVELDGFDTSSNIILLAATNRPEILDPALLRAGRFDRQVLVDRPDKIGRQEILKLHSRKVALAENVDLEKIAAVTPGFTGADLANLVNEAALAGTRRKANAIENQDFDQALERTIAGLEKKNRLINKFERKVVAYHEMGHALVSGALKGSDEVYKVSIIPRGIGSLGYTIQRPTEERFLMTREELLAKIAILLGGRAAETVTFGHTSTGAADDIGKATDIARKLIVHYGMDKDLGSVAYEREHSSYLTPEMSPKTQYSEETARKIDCAIRKLINEALEKSASILTKNKSLLVEVSELLLESETLDANELKPYFKRIQS